MRGVVVPAAALSAATEVSARRVVPGDSLRASSLSHKHQLHHEQPAPARLSTPLFNRHSLWRRTVPTALHADRHHTHMPATLCLRRHQRHIDHMPAALPTTLHGRPCLPDDRLPGWPAVPASSVSHLQR
jgi:hypothetical protein